MMEYTLFRQGAGMPKDGGGGGERYTQRFPNGASFEMSQVSGGRAGT